MKKKESTKRGYRLSPIGPIPSEWNVDKLKIGCKIQGGYAFSSESFKEVGIPVIRITNLIDGQVIPDEVCYEEKDELERFLLKKGDLLIAMSGATTGKIGIYELDSPAYLNQRVGRFIINEKKLKKGYLRAVLSLQKTRTRILIDAIGGAQPNISNTDIENLIVPLPPISEQDSIAKAINTWDKCITKLQALIEKKEKRKKWLIQKLVPGKVRLKGFQQEFKEYRIADLFEMMDRYVEWNENHLYNLVSIRRRFGGLFYRGDLFGEQISVKKLKCIHRGDFLISKRQVSHGAWAVVPAAFHDAKVSDEYDCLAIKDESKINSSFWAWYCQLSILKHYAYLDSNGVHIEKLIFDFNQFKKRKVFIPATFQEQASIADVLRTADKEIQLHREKLKQLQEQKRGLTLILVSGEKRLKK